MKPRGKRPLRRHRHRWGNNIKVAVKMWDGCKDWIDVAQDREWCRAPLNAGNFFTSVGPVSFSRTLLHEVSLTRHSRKHFSYVILSSLRLPMSNVNGIA